MKIEMGESLFYSWLRHVKSCQVVQTNWKASSQWELHNAEKLEVLMDTIGKYFMKNMTMMYLREISITVNCFGRGNAMSWEFS